MNKEQNAALDEIRAEFPLFDDADLDQEKHHCEWSVQHDRKRLNALLDTLQARAQLASDGMCNADNPANRCICREEFGYRVCVSASDVMQVPRALLELIESSWRVPNGLPKSVPDHVETKITGGLAQLRALLNGGRV